MELARHYRALESMYASAPVNAFYTPSMTVSKGRAVIAIPLSEKFHHSAGAVHGSVYFKMLDDAAFFAASSMETDVFVLTSSFTTYFLRPVASGILRSEGRVVSATRSQLVAESVVVDGAGKEVGRGSGIFVRGHLPLTEAVGYRP